MNAAATHDPVKAAEEALRAAHLAYLAAGDTAAADRVAALLTPAEQTPEPPPAARVGDQPSAASSRATRPGPRSLELLDWICRVGVGTVETAARALGMQPPTAYSHVQRLTKAGMVERHPTLQNHPALLTATARGLRENGRDPRVSGVRLRHHQWEHYIAIAQTAAWLAQHEQTLWWRHEREFANDPRSAAWHCRYLIRGREHSHRPDLACEIDGTGTVAVEVERSAKSQERLAWILTGWADAVEHGQLDRVVYVTPDGEVRRAVERAIARLARTRPDAQNCIVTLPYEQVALPAAE